MATGKRYYWIKLKDSFMTSDSVDYVMSQPNGAEYVVIYQMLCLKTINTNGRLSRKIGEVVIPYDARKLARDLKHFKPETIQKAIDLYKSLGLIFDDGGVLAMTDHENLVGSETDWSGQKRRQRDDSDGQTGGHSVDSDVDKPVDSSVDNVHTDIRDKEKDIDIRDKEKDINKRESTRARARAREEEKNDFDGFEKPTIEEITDFCKARGSPIDPKRFYDYYDVRGWIDSKGNPVTEWKSRLIAWEDTPAETQKPKAGRKNSRKKGQEVHRTFEPTKFD